MSKHLLGGLGDIAQSGLFRAALRNWWITLPIGLVAWHSIQKRRKAGTLTTMHVIGDMVPAITVVGTLVLLNHTLEEREKSQPARKALPPPTMALIGVPQAEPIHESFTPQEGAHPVVAFTEAAPPPTSAPPAATAPVVTTIQDDNPYG